MSVLSQEEIMSRRVGKFLNAHQELSTSTKNSLLKIKETLDTYEIDSTLLNRISETIASAEKLNSFSEMETKLKALSDTFWE